MDIKDFRDRDFAEYCEYLVAFKLEELGWKVYQPLSDRYIDIVAIRKLGDKIIFRTIQVKGSRLEKEGKQESYGLTHKPKDIMHDPSHFFIWVFFDKSDNPNFIILSVFDFLNLMGKDFFRSMSWKKGNCRIHFLLNDKRLANYINKWDILTKEIKEKVSLKSIEYQEISEKFNSDKCIDIWKESNAFLKEIPEDMLERIRRKTDV